MTFESDKNSVLSKTDKSSKGSIDKPILELINKINQQNDYFTTSSCSGRITLTNIPKTKFDHKWFKVWHRKITEQEFKEELNKLEEPTLFKLESSILHVRCRTLEVAQTLLQKGRDVGFRNGGIISTKTKIIVELRSTEKLEMPIYTNELIIKENQISFLINLVNQRLEKNFKKINELFKTL